MRILRVYVDTSVVGGCFDPEFSLWSNRLVEDFHAGRFLPVVSSVVAAELESAPEQVRTKFEEILRLEPAFLEPTEEVVKELQTYRATGEDPDLQRGQSGAWLQTATDSFAPRGGQL